MTIAITNARKRTRIVRQPVGTNHFQLRVHQLVRGRESRGGGFCSTELFYFNDKARGNQSLRRDIELDFHRSLTKIEDMKIHLSLRIISAGIFLVLINACTTTTSTTGGPLVGTWSNSLGTVWTIKADGTFDVDPNHDGKRDIWGTYTVAGDTITIQETGRTAAMPKDCTGPGVYKFSQPDANTLTFALVSDACKLRKKNVLLAQHRQ
jgi:hypothetical protein